jgi:hypothetical protein
MDYKYKAQKYKLQYQNEINNIQSGGSINIEGRIVNLYFIRHGESKHNLNYTNKKIFDSPLTKIGIDQSSGLHKDINEIKPDLIYSSPLHRTLQTMFYSLANKYNNIPIIIIIYTVRLIMVYLDYYDYC